MGPKGEYPSEDNSTSSPLLVQYQGLRKVMILSLILSWKSYLICTPEEVKSHMSAHMSKMFKSSCENLTEEQAIIFENLLTDFQNIFGRNDTELGCFVGWSII